VRALLEHGADPEDDSSLGGFTALHRASMKGHTKVVQELLSAGAYVDPRLHRLERTPLIEAVVSGHAETCRVLIAHGADVNAHHPEGFCLNHATAKSRLDLVQLLIEAGSNIESMDKYGQTSLMQAAQLGDLAIVRALLAAGASTHSAKPSNSGNPTHMNCLERSICYGHPAVMRELFEAGATLDLPSVLNLFRDSKTMEEMLECDELRGRSFSRGHADCLYYLLRKGVTDDRILTRLFFAVNWKPQGGLAAVRLVHKAWAKAEKEIVWRSGFPDSMDHLRAINILEKQIVQIRFAAVCADPIRALAVVMRISQTTAIRCLGWAVEFSATSN